MGGKNEDEKLRIIFIDQHFALPGGMTIPRSFAIVQFLVKGGHKVTVITGMNRKSGLGKYWKGGLLNNLDLERINIVLVGVPYTHFMAFLHRLLAFFGFMILSCFEVLFLERPDLVFATSTPLTVGIPALFVSKLKKVPFVFEVRDLWPEFAIEIGMLRNAPMIRLAEWLERLCYRYARKVFTISHGLRERLVERGVSSEKVKTFPIGVDLSAVNSMPVLTSFRVQNGLEGKFVAVYAGAFGPANGLDTLIEAGKYLKTEPDIVIVLIGEGKMKETLLAQKRLYDAGNILFFEAIPREELIGIMKDLDVGLMITKNLIPSMAQCPNLPRKFFDYLAAGLPVVVNVEGDMSKLVKEKRIGLICKEKDPMDLANCILQLYLEKQLRAEMGRNACRIISRFDISRIAELFEKELLGAIN